jgi:hypothetical protein
VGRGGGDRAATRGASQCDAPTPFQRPIRSEYSWGEWEARKPPVSGALGRRIGPMYSWNEYPGRGADRVVV